MRYTRKDIKAGNYVLLGNQPFDGKKTMETHINEQIECLERLKNLPAKERELTGHQINQSLKNFSTPTYMKVVKVRPLTYKSMGLKIESQFYLKWVTDVCENYQEVMSKGGKR